MVALWQPTGKEVRLLVYTNDLNCNSLHYGLYILSEYFLKGSILYKFIKFEMRRLYI